LRRVRSCHLYEALKKGADEETLDKEEGIKNDNKLIQRIRPKSAPH
jgi:hypothetical protein